LALTLALAASCTNLPVATEDAKTPDVFDRIRALDILPRSPQPEPGAVIGGQRAKPMVYTGVVVPATEAGARAQAGGGGAGGGAGGEGYELNFENTPIAMVAKAVLGESAMPWIRASRERSASRPASRCRNPIWCSCSKASCA
jgi:general secretion pathway protein D